MLKGVSKQIPPFFVSDKNQRRCNVTSKKAIRMSFNRHRDVKVCSKNFQIDINETLFEAKSESHVTQTTLDEL